MNHLSPTRSMREHPDLEQLKRQAKELLRRYIAGQPKAVKEVTAQYRGQAPVPFALHDAQLVLARSYGFASWPKLKAYVDGITVPRLAEAVRAGDILAVRRMLRARPELADMALSYGDERRPLHFAVTQRLPEMVRLLMRHGANAREGIYPHRAATTAWMLAHDRGYDEIVSAIEEEEARSTVTPPEEPGGDVEERDDAREAVASGDVEWLRGRHAAGTLVNRIRWDGGGLLTEAVQHNQPDVLRMLLDFGFDPNERVSSGEGDWVAWSQGYPLWHAAALGRLELAATLLRYGANPNVHVDSSGSSVYSAYSHRQWPMVDLLRQHGGVVSADTAAIYRQTELARQMLLDNDRGVLPPGVVAPETPLAEELLRFAASGGDPEIVRMALERIDWPREDERWFRVLTEPLYFWHQIPWLYAGNKELDRSTYLACFRLILARCEANCSGGSARTALHEVAAMRDHIDDHEAAAFAQALLDAGARVGQRDDLLRSTALGWACRWGRAAVVRVLLERGADPVEADGEAWSRPRAWAEKCGHSAVIAVLSEFGG